VKKAVEAVAALDRATARLIRWVWRSQLEPARWPFVMVVLEKVDEYKARIGLDSSVPL
jgi:hypothetical protein